MNRNSRLYQKQLSSQFNSRRRTQWDMQQLTASPHSRQDAPAKRHAAIGKSK